MSVGRTISAGCAMAFVPAGCRRSRASFGWRSRRSARRPSRSSRGCSPGAKLLRSEPLRALVIGAFVRGLSMLRRRVAVRAGRAREALEIDRVAHLQRAARALRCVQTPRRLRGPAGRAVPGRGLSVRPSRRAKEGVLVDWGFTADGERVLLAVMLGMRESHEDWLALGRDLTARGLGAPMLIVADGAPGLTGAVEQCWPASDASTAPSTAFATCSPSCPNGSANASARPTGKHSTTRSTNATPSSASRRWSTSSTRRATTPRPNASPTTWTRSSCTCATPPDTAAGGAQPTCSSGRWARSNAGPR